MDNLPNFKSLTPKQITRFLGNINKIESGCWIWTSKTTSLGYGMFSFNARFYLAHRLSFEFFKGEIPKGLCLDHLCRIRNCVNPDHLEPVTQHVNLMRGKGCSAMNAQKTHCPQGHPYDEVNTKIRHLPNGDTSRRCRACIKMESAKYILQRAEKRYMSLK